MLLEKIKTSKSEECYTRLFESLNDVAAENELDLNPQFILTLSGTTGQRLSYQNANRSSTAVGKITHL